MPDLGRLVQGHGIVGIEAVRQPGGPAGGWYTVRSKCECGDFQFTRDVGLEDVTEKAIQAWFTHYREVP